MSSPLTVSVIVPTRNSAKTLSSCLASIRHQTFQAVELIVVDNNSSDDTRRIASDFGARVLLKGPERSSQLNFGASNSRGKYIYRVDADMIVSTSVVEEAVRMCEDRHIDGVAIRCVSDPRISNWSQVRYQQRLGLYDFDVSVAIRFLTRTSFDKIGGFDESLTGFEDYDLHDRFVDAGFSFGRIQASELHVGEPETMAEVARKHFYYGKNLNRYLRSRSGRIRFGPTGLRRRGSLRAVLQSPGRLPDYLLYEAVRYLSSLLGMLSAI